MSARALGGSLMSYLYNHVIGKLPSRHIRRFFLRLYLGGMGDRCGIQLCCHFINGRKVSFGDRCVINFGSLFDGRIYPIEVGSDVSIGPEASILTLGHDPHSSSFADRGGPVRIGDRAWIGYRAVILPGVSIGPGAVVGAGAVVTRDVEEYTIVAGNPAKPIGTRPKDLEYQLTFDPPLT